MTIEEMKSSQAVFLRVRDLRDFFPGMSEQKLRCRIRSGMIPVEHAEDGRYLFVNRRDFIRLIEGG